MADEAELRVYCERCRHFRSGFSDRPYEHCAVETAKPMQTVRTYLRPDSPVPYVLPAEKNRRNDCPDYEALPYAPGRAGRAPAPARDAPERQVGGHRHGQG